MSALALRSDGRTVYPRDGHIRSNVLLALYTQHGNHLRFGGHFDLDALRREISTARELSLFITKAPDTTDRMDRQWAVERAIEWLSAGVGEAASTSDILEAAALIFGLGRDD